MALRAVLDALGMTHLEEYDAGTETTTDTETSDEFVDFLEQQERTMAKRKIKSKASAEVPNDNSEDVAIAASNPSPELSFETQTPAAPLDNDEDGHNMAKSNGESEVIPEILTDGAENIAIVASPGLSPNESSELLAPASPPNNPEDNHDMTKINIMSKATPEAPNDSAEDVNIAASRGLWRKAPPKTLAPASLLENNEDGLEMTIVNMTLPDDSADDPGNVTSILSPAIAPRSPLGRSVITVEEHDIEDSHDMAEGNEKSEDVPEASTAGPDDTTSTIMPASSPKVALETSEVTVESRHYKDDRDMAKVTTTSNTLPKAFAFSLDAAAVAPLLPASLPKSALETSEITVGLRDNEENHDLAKGNKKAKTIPVKPALPPKSPMIIFASKETGTVAGAAQLGKTTGAKPGDGGLSQRVLQDTSKEDRTEPAKKKPKPGSKKKKTAAQAMTSSSTGSTVKVSTSRNIAATTNDSILALASLTVSNPTNTTVSSSIPARFTTPARSNIVAPASTPRKVQLFLKTPFGFDEHREELKCRKSECGKLTNCYDGSTVICPRCGVTSYFRYCSLEHLLDKDMMFHWADECGTCSIPTESLPLVDKITLVVRPAAMRQYISCDLCDNPARHRQAVYHSSNGAAGDYFVFNDASLGPAGPLAVGAGDILAVVIITADHGVYQGHSIFQEILEDCLRRGFTRPDKCLALADIVTKELVTSGQWCEEVLDCLVFQMMNEFAYQIPQEMLYRFQPVA